MTKTRAQAGACRSSDMPGLKPLSSRVLPDPSRLALLGPLPVVTVPAPHIKARRDPRRSLDQSGKFAKASWRTSPNGLSGAAGRPFVDDSGGATTSYHNGCSHERIYVLAHAVPRSRCACQLLKKSTTTENTCVTSRSCQGGTI